MVKDKNGIKKYATAYINLFENIVIANVLEAANELEALKKTIILNNKDSSTKEWIESIGEIDVKDFKSIILNNEQSVDAIEIKNSK